MFSMNLFKLNIHDIEDIPDVPDIIYIYIYIYIYIESKGTVYSTFYVSVCKATVPTPSR